MARNTMTRPFALGPALLHAMPKIGLLNRVAQAYRNWYSGENNVWADTNGEFWVLKQFMPSCRRVFDVGANFGDWTRQCLTNNPALEIHCFEAAADNFAMQAVPDLGPTVVRNHVAVGNTCGSIELSLFGTRSPFNSIVVSTETAVGAPVAIERVALITLDQYAHDHEIDHIDYVKIDVEGAEKLVLAGMAMLLTNNSIDAVQLEHGRFGVYSRCLLLDYFEIFGQHGFAMYKMVQHKLVHYAKYSTDIESFDHQNWLCVRIDSPLHQIARAAAGRT